MWGRWIWRSGGGVTPVVKLDFQLQNSLYKKKDLEIKGAQGMAELYVQYERSPYFDRQSGMTLEEYHTTIEKSCCLYVGNLSYFTTEAQIYDFFNRAGEVKRVVMGLDKFQKTPCGFCFVEYYTSDDTEAAIRFLNGMQLDDRQIRLDRDPGFVEGRQYGRGKSGGQVRDEYRRDFDQGRGGWGKVYQVAAPTDLAATQDATGEGRGGGGYLPREGHDDDADGPRREREGSRENSVDRKRGREPDDDDDDRGRRRRGRRTEGSDSD